MATKAEQRVTELLARVGADELVRYMAEIPDHADHTIYGSQRWATAVGAT